MPCQSSWKSWSFSHAAEEGQDIGVAPLIVAPFGPAVVVLGDAAVEYLAVDGGGAAGGLAAWDDQVGLLGGYAGAVGPAVGAVRREENVIAQFQVIGEMIEIGIIRPGLEQQDALVWVLGQTGCDGGAGRTGSNHDIVVPHRSLR